MDDCILTTFMRACTHPIVCPYRFSFSYIFIVNTPLT